MYKNLFKNEAAGLMFHFMVLLAEKDLKFKENGYGTAFYEQLISRLALGIA